MFEKEQTQSLLFAFFSWINDGKYDMITGNEQ